MVARQYTDNAEITAPILLEMAEKYPWYAASRAALCRKTLSDAGPEAAVAILRESLLYLPDISYVASSLIPLNYADYTDPDLDAGGPETGTEGKRGRIHIFGGDYFSREDYENVALPEDAGLRRLGVVDNSLPDAEYDNAERPESFNLISETLARIYADQDCQDKAREVYTQLSLQNPEKSAYFATLIENLKN